MGVRIPAPDTGKTFFKIVIKIVLFSLKRPKINEKETGSWPILKSQNSVYWQCTIVRGYIAAITLQWFTSKPEH